MIISSGTVFVCSLARKRTDISLLVSYIPYSSTVLVQHVPSSCFPFHSPHSFPRSSVRKLMYRHLRRLGGRFPKPHPPHITVPRDPSLAPYIRGTVQDWYSVIISHFSGTVPRRWRCNVSREDKWVCTLPYSAQSDGWRWVYHCIDRRWCVSP